MSSSRPAVTPTTSSYPPSDAVFSTTPPLAPNVFSGSGPGPGSHTSPSPRSRSRRTSRSRDLANPGSRSHLSHFDAIDNNPPADPDRPSAPAVHPAATYSTFPSNPPRTSSLAARNPPRTSSLLPPARIVVDPGTPNADAPELRDPFNDPRPAPKVPDSAREGGTRHKRGHSRSSSAGGLSDTLRNLNRWSASTTSSRASHLADFTRRVSAEILGVAFTSPGKKFHRRTPSTPGGSPRSSIQRGNRTEPAAAAAYAPLQSLPQISTGPSLEDEVLEAHALRSFSPDQSGQALPQSQQDTGRFWDDQRGEEGEQGLLSYQAHLAEPPDKMVMNGSTMPYTQNGQARGHSRSRSTGAKGSADTTVSSRSRDKDRDRERDRDRQGKPISQKAMLSKALQKANTAVQLDNAQNLEGARRAYAEACAVLQQVLLRTSGEEDRRKLDAIHETYLARVMELDEQLVDMEPEGKALPRRPESNDLHDVLNGQIAADQYSRPATGERDRIQEEDLDAQVGESAQEPMRNPPPPSRASPLPGDATRDPRDGPSSYLTQQYSLQSAFSRARYNNGSTLRPPNIDNTYMPPPLSPRRPFSPARLTPPPVEHESPQRPPPELPAHNTQLAPPMPHPGHKRVGSHESVSWLDPIDESEHSSVTSVHSRSSSRVVRKHIRAASGATEAEFDAALDDAIEAAYDDGYDPETQYSEHPYHDTQVDPIASTLRRVEIARELVRESEREALELANEREQRLRRQQQLEDEEYRRHEAVGDDEFYDGNDSEEDERLLEQMTKGNAIEDFAFGVQPKPPVPRESDSSGMTGRTWHSSMGSNPPTGTTLLTPVSEDNAPPYPSGPLPALPPHAMAPLPPPPTSAGSQSSGQSVRNRRLSGQNPKELKIETTKLAPSAPATAGPAIPSMPKAGSYIVQQRQALSAGPNRTAGPFSARAGPSPIPGTLDEEPEDAPLPPLAFSHDDYSRVGTPSVVRPNLRKNYSASSLKSLKTRNLSISHMEETPDHSSPGTPLSTQFGSRLPAMPSLPPGLVKDRANSATTSGLHLFENHFHSADEPGSPNPLHPDAPAPLEPCPSDVTLRPFWLMRALYQTLCHPRGGYVSTKLFVPRDAWRVKGVKLKGVDEKIANCDLLTAALQKLGRVDTCDADAVLDEMQALENVLEQVQTALTRRLGSDVGVQGAGAMFKDAAAAGAGDGVDPASMPRSASVAGKASGFSWRRLRSKNSSANLPGLATGYGGKGGSGGNGGGIGGGASSTNLHEGMGKDMVIASLPMTSHPTSRPTKRDVGAVGFGGPNAHYMASLARLFDAAQTVDQIARQVDDPGLRHADKTQVGIELCTRHAAEFFAFYICRFALADMTLLLDKFVKRGTEWVLA